MRQRRYQGIGMTSQRTRDRLVSRLRERGVCDNKVLEAIGSTPRHLFVDEALASRAYEDTALPIGHGQTLSQPHVVALMTATLLAGGKRRRILEVGTGSGYQAAILAQLVSQVYTLERIAGLQDRAQELIRELRLYNVYFRHCNGRLGWQEKAPFDGILLTAAPREVPSSLVDQLNTGGRLVAPVGEAGQQQLVIIERSASGFSERRAGRVSFVPLLTGLE